MISPSRITPFRATNTIWYSKYDAYKTAQFLDKDCEAFYTDNMYIVNFSKTGKYVSIYQHSILYTWLNY